MKAQHDAAGNQFFLCEKESLHKELAIDAEPNGKFPLERAAALLAMHCLVRGRSPTDYLLLVSDAASVLALNEKAQGLLNAGRAIKSNVKITRREREVLDGVARRLANKEIAALLNLSERTIKFHVSSLLRKFGVRGRVDLIREG